MNWMNKNELTEQEWTVTKNETKILKYKTYNGALTTIVYCRGKIKIVNKNYNDNDSHPWKK